MLSKSFFGKIRNLLRSANPLPSNAVQTSRRRFVLGALATTGAMLAPSGMGLSGEANAQSGEPGGASDGPQQRRREPLTRSQRRDLARPQGGAPARRRRDYRPRPHYDPPSVAYRCRNDRRFARNNPYLCRRYTAYRRHEPRYCIQLGPLTICE